MKSSKDQALLGKKIESIRKRLVRAGPMKWQALDKTGRPNATQAELLEWEDWKRIVEVPKTPQDYSKVVNGRRAVSAKLAGKISQCFGIPADLLEPNVPLNDFKDYLDEDLREPDRHVPVEETRQLLEITQKREKAALEAGRKKNRRAESLYNSLIEGYSASPYTAVLEQLSRICLEYGSFLESTGRPDSAIALYGRLTDDFDKRWTFENAEDRRRFSEPVACAMIEKARLLQCKGLTDDAIAVLQEAISRFGEDADKFPSLRAYLIKATQTLRDLGQTSGPIDEKGPSGPTLTGDVASAETDLDYIDFLPLPQQKRLAEFRKRFVETGQAVLLLGPQIGVRSGLPDESTIWERLAEAGGLPLQPPLDLCVDIVRTHGSEWMHRHLAELLDDEAAPLSDIHQIAARIDFRAYMTTNTDRLMEWALKDAGRAHRSIFFDGLLLRIQARLVSIVQSQPETQFKSGWLNGFAIPDIPLPVIFPHDMSQPPPGIFAAVIGIYNYFPLIRPVNGDGVPAGPEPDMVCAKLETAIEKLTERPCPILCNNRLPSIASNQFKIAFIRPVMVYVNSGGVDLGCGNPSVFIHIATAVPVDSKGTVRNMNHIEFSLILREEYPFVKGPEITEMAVHAPGAGKAFGNQFLATELQSPGIDIE